MGVLTPTTLSPSVRHCYVCCNNHLTESLTCSKATVAGLSVLLVASDVCQSFQPRYVAQHWVHGGKQTTTSRVLFLSRCRLTAWKGQQHLLVSRSAASRIGRYQHPVLQVGILSSSQFTVLHHVHNALPAYKFLRIRSTVTKLPTKIAQVLPASEHSLLHVLYIHLRNFYTEERIVWV